MASIRKRGHKYHTQIRRKDYPSVTRSFNSITTARKWARTVEGQIESHTFAPTDSVHLGELFTRYQKTIMRQHKGASQERYRLAAMNGEFGDIQLVSLTRSKLIAYRDQRLQCVAPATVRRDFNLLRAVLNTAVNEWGITLPTNPAASIGLPKATEQRSRRLEGDEERRLLEHAPGELASAITLALETALRRGEITALRRSDVDFKKSTLHIATSKNGQSRTVPLSRRASKVLSARAAQDVIPLQLFHFTPNGLSVAFRRLCLRLGIRDLRFHDLRHEATSRLFEKGLNPVEVATITGHKDTKMLMRYTHLRAEDLARKLG